MVDLCWMIENGERRHGQCFTTQLQAVVKDQPW